MLTIICPSCGGPVLFQSAASILAVCEFCKSTLVRHDLDLENLGKMAQLQTDGSPIQLRAEGRYHQVHFGVIGRIQMRFSQGLWNEWYLLFDDMRNGWLGESQGNYGISFVSDAQEDIPEFSTVKIGQSVQLQNHWFEVRDIQEAVCLSGEGELPFRVGAGYVAPVVDLVGEDRRFATIDYSEETPLIFVGEYMDFDQLQLSGLKEFDGW